MLAVREPIAPGEVAVIFALVPNPEVKQFLGDMTTTVQGRLKTAQEILAKVYGDKV